jgi:hypothetical protein
MDVLPCLPSLDSSLEFDAERIKVAIETNGGSVEGLCKCIYTFKLTCVIWLFPDILFDSL